MLSPISSSSPNPESAPTWSASLGTSGRRDRRTGSGATNSATSRRTASTTKVLFVCFVGNAELACHLALGWPLPVNVLDLYAEFRNHVNGRLTPHGKGLLGALAYFGLDTIDAKRKDAMRDRIMQGWPFTAEEIADILKYCASDVDAMVRLLPMLLPLHRHADCTASRRVREGVGTDGACRRADRHGDFSAARRQAGLALRARCDGAGDRRALRRLCARP